MNYNFGQNINLNARSIQEKIQVASDLQIGKDAEEDLLKRGLDRGGMKGVKKEDKKNQDGKVIKKGIPDKGQVK